MVTTHGDIAPSTRTPSDKVESALLDAAALLLARDGVQGLSVRAVSAAAGVAPMGIYSRFGGKEGLIDALAFRAVDDFSAAVFGERVEDPVSDFERACRRYRTWALTNPHLYRVLFMEDTVLRSGSPFVRERAHAFLGRLGDLIAAQPAWSGDRATAAQMVFSAVHGAVSIELNGLDRTAPEASYGLLLDVLLSGLTAPRSTAP